MYFANLPWYDLPEIRFATDLLWSRLAENLRGQGFLRVPSNLDRVTSYRKQWASEKLIFSQACGYDVVLPYADHLRALATPVYNALGCRGAYYSSFVTVHLDSPVEHLADLRGSRCVINEVTSHSGMNSIRAMIAGMHRNGRFFSEILVSGSHELSLEKIARKEVDVAAIDSITYA